MEYRLVKKDAFSVTGKSIKVSTKNGENFKRIPEFWQQCSIDETFEKICSIDNKQNLLGVCFDFNHYKEELSYMIAVEDVNNSGDDRFETREIPAATWAVFTSIGPIPYAIQDTMKIIFEEWCPTSGFVHADAPDLEVYLPGDISANDYKCEVWIPIVKK